MRKGKPRRCAEFVHSSCPCTTSRPGLHHAACVLCSCCADDTKQRDRALCVLFSLARKIPPSCYLRSRPASTYFHLQHSTKTTVVMVVHAEIQVEWEKTATWGRVTHNHAVSCTWQPSIETMGDDSVAVPCRVKNGMMANYDSFLSPKATYI